VAGISNAPPPATALEQRRKRSPRVSLCAVQASQVRTRAAPAEPHALQPVVPRRRPASPPMPELSLSLRSRRQRCQLAPCPAARGPGRLLHASAPSVPDVRPSASTSLPARAGHAVLGGTREVRLGPARRGVGLRGCSVLALRICSQLRLPEA